MDGLKSCSPPVQAQSSSSCSEKPAHVQAPIDVDIDEAGSTDFPPTSDQHASLRQLAEQQRTNIFMNTKWINNLSLEDAMAGFKRGVQKNFAESWVGLNLDQPGDRHDAAKILQDYMIDFGVAESLAPLTIACHTTISTLRDSMLAMSKRSADIPEAVWQKYAGRIWANTYNDVRSHADVPFELSFKLVSLILPWNVVLTDGELAIAEERDDEDDDYAIKNFSFAVSPLDMKTKMQQFLHFFTRSAVGETLANDDDGSAGNVLASLCRAFLRTLDFVLDDLDIETQDLDACSDVATVCRAVIELVDDTNYLTDDCGIDDLATLSKATRGPTVFGLCFGFLQDTPFLNDRMAAICSKHAALIDKLPQMKEFHACLGGTKTIASMPLSLGCAQLELVATELNTIFEACPEHYTKAFPQVVIDTCRHFIREAKTEAPDIDFLKAFSKALQSVTLILPHNCEINTMLFDVGEKLAGLSCEAYTTDLLCVVAKLCSLATSPPIATELVVEAIAKTSVPSTARFSVGDDKNMTDACQHLTRNIVHGLPVVNKEAVKLAVQLDSICAVQTQQHAIQFIDDVSSLTDILANATAWKSKNPDSTSNDESFKVLHSKFVVVKAKLVQKPIDTTEEFTTWMQGIRKHLDDHAHAIDATFSRDIDVLMHAGRLIEGGAPDSQNWDEGVAKQWPALLDASKVLTEFDKLDDMTKLADEMGNASTIMEWKPFIINRILFRIIVFLNVFIDISFVRTLQEPWQSIL